MGRGPLAARRWISPSVVFRQEPLSHFTDLPWHAEWGDPVPIHAGHAPHPRLAPGVLTHPWRAEPGPPRRGRSGSCFWPWRPAPNFPTRRAPGFRDWTAAGRASTCHPQRAWHPSLGVPGPPARNARVAGREVSEGGERIVTEEGAPPSPDSTGRSWAPSWQSARGTHRQPLPSSLALWVGRRGGRGLRGRPRALPAIPPPAGSPSRPFPGHPRAPSAGTPGKRARAHPPRSPGRAEAGTARWGAAHGHDGRGGRLLLSWHWAQNTQRVPCLPCFQHDHTSPAFPCLPSPHRLLGPTSLRRPRAVSEIVGRRR